VQQIGLPMRIALGAVLAIAALWFVALRPKPDAAPATPTPAPTAPGVAGLTRSINSARAATAAANASVTKVQRTAAATSAGTATNTTGGVAAPAAKSKTVVVTKSSSGTAVAAKPKAVVVKPAAAAKPKAIVVKPASAAKPTAVVVAKPKPKVVVVDPAAPLLADLARGKAVVLMFGNASSVSRAVAGAVRAVPRRHGKVVIRVSDIRQVGAYSLFTTQTPVTQAPTVLVIGPSRKARVIVGYTYVGEIDQAVADVLAASRG